MSPSSPTLASATLVCGTAARRRPTSSVRTPRPRAAGELLKCLGGLRSGTLEMALPDGTTLRFGMPPVADADAGALRPPHLTVHDWTMFEDVLARGDIAFGESYVAGAWDTPDLTALLTLLNSNRESLDRALRGRWWSLLVERLRHRRNANSRAGSRRNIMAHYDLGNRFYAGWLDPTMSYSSALFAEGTATLADAQKEKYRRIIRELGIGRGDTVLEIGCGWGGFAEIAAAEAGAIVTGITLSPAQLAYARLRMHRARLTDRVRLELTDYRDLPRRAEIYDHVVSIEMFEAVGERWWPTYFDTVRKMMKPGGKAMVQTITIDDALFAGYRKGTDFIQQHVFPGGMLPSPTEFGRQAKQAGLVASAPFAFGFDYARTLAIWQQSFNAQWPQIATQGFDERFRRLWNFYLSYCQAGFMTGTTDVCQFRLERAA